MISKYTYKGLIWIDLENPTDDELKHVMEEHSIAHAVIDEMKDLSLYSKVDPYPNYIYLILHFPEIDNVLKQTMEREVDFIISDKFIITTHYESINSLLEFSKTFEVDAMLEKNAGVDHAGFIFFHFLKSLYIHSRYQLNNTTKILREIENNIYKKTSDSTVFQISKLNRILLDFRQSLRFHEDVLFSFEVSANKLFNRKFDFYITDIINEYKKTYAVLDSHKEILEDLRNTNDSLLANKTNEIIKSLTIITLLVSPITVISSLFVINGKFLSSSNLTHYLLVLFGMSILVIFIYIYIKNKKWL